MIHPFLFVVPIFFLSKIADTYKIDASCAKAGVGSKIAFALESAFQMAEAGKAALESGRHKPDGQDIIRPFEVEQLINYLFYKGDNRGQDIRRMRLPDAYDSFEGILNYIKLPGHTETPTSKDVIIYCDDSRFQKDESKTRKWATDTTTGIRLKYDQRPCHDGIGGKLALAATWRGLEENTGRLLPSQIQICPWFLDLLKLTPYTTWKDVSKKSLFGLKVITQNEENKWGFTQIDALNLLDKVLLHELTHTEKGGWTTDTNLGHFFFGARKPAYGWSQCKKLAKQGDWIYDEDYNAPSKNADTLALFGSIALMMSDKDNPRAVDADGRVIPIDHTIQFT